MHVRHKRHRTRLPGAWLALSPSMRIEATLLDRLMYCVQPTIEPILSIELRFAHRLDTERLVRALALTLAADPILSARLVADGWRPYWEPLAIDASTLLRLE